MKKLFSLFLFAVSILAFSQKQKMNLSFEELKNGFPINWEIFGKAKSTITPDFQNKKEGKNSIVIVNESNDFKALAFTIPENYEGEEITLSGYLKTENVNNGFAGLWLRIDPNVAFDNMQKKNISGTRNWEKYEIKLKMNPEKTEKIVLGALLVGVGKIWVDDLKVSIDGKPISSAKLFSKELTKAYLDKEFDDGSKISNINLNKHNIDNLKNLGLIWGFLKYYHPKVSTGDYNWDYELFRILPKINNASISESNKIFCDWIKSFGEIDTEKKIFEQQKIKILPDLQWIENKNFSKELTDLLLKVKNAKRKNENHYIRFFDGVGNPDFINENPYQNLKFPDEGFRLLTLFRYWNMIQYYFPYKNLIEEDWKSVLAEFIPKYLKNTNEQEYTLTTLELIARIHDTHANIWSKNENLNQFYGRRQIPAKVIFLGNTAIIKDFSSDDFAKKTGLEIGDIILEINNKSVENIINEKLKYLPASNLPTQLRDLSKILLRTNEEKLTLKIKRGNEAKIFSTNTYESKDITFKNNNPQDFFKILSDSVAYFYMGSIKDSDNLENIIDKIKNTKGLVIDFRSYPSDFVVFKLGKLLKQNSTEFVKFSKTNQNLPGLFTLTPSLELPGSMSNYKGKIAILVNETTQSSAEYHTMAFRTAPNAKIFGSTTAGADGNVSEINLPAGVTTMISGIGIYYPDGKETQRIGIIPDIEVKPTIEGIKTGKDEVLEKAIYWIHNE